MVNVWFRQKAMSSLRWLRNDADASVEFNQLEQFAINAQLDGSSGLALRDLRSPSVYKPILIGVLLMIFQQFSGVNAVIFYTGEIFNKAGFGANSSVPTVIVGAVLFVFTIISCVLADYAGRRILLVVSGIFMSISIVVLGVDFYLTEVMQMESLGWLALLCLIIYIAFFSIGWGPVPWLMLSEIVPARARGFGGGIGTCINWLAAFVTTKEFLDLTTFVHNYGAFWIFGGVCCISVIFVVLFLFETKGKSLEEIEDHFRGRD
jgi:Sugar (and other) transporter